MAERTLLEAHFRIVHKDSAVVAEPICPVVVVTVDADHLAERELFPIEMVHAFCLLAFNMRSYAVAA